jgi:hypothetical protein
VQRLLICTKTESLSLIYRCRKHLSLVCLLAICRRLRSAYNDKKDEMTFVFVFYVEGQSIMDATQLPLAKLKARTKRVDDQ